MASKNWLWAAGTVVAMGAAVGVTLAVSAPARTPSAQPATSTASAPTLETSAVTFTMKGAYTILVPSGSATFADGEACRGPGYRDAQEGTAVRVYDGQGKLLATGGLPQGKFAHTPIADACKFDIAIAGVPDGPPMYSVAVGDHGGHPVNSATAHSWVVIQP
jgi:hypothetical protein